jgi:uncharacterized protein YbjT (DUF2867 family)
MADSLVLVTGASGGRQGKTGRHVSEMLLARGVPVRAFVHTIDERSDRLRSLGAETFEGDLLDIQSVQRAVTGVSSIYFAYPVQEGLLDATAAMAVAAREAGVKRIIDMVMLVSSPSAPTPRMRQNYLSEQIFEWAGIGAAHVRAAVFYENIRALAASTLASRGTVLLPWGSDSTIVPLVAGEDVARVSATLLASGSVPPGSIYPLIGEVLALLTSSQPSRGYSAATFDTSRSLTKSGATPPWRRVSTGTRSSICRICGGSSATFPSRSRSRIRSKP